MFSAVFFDRMLECGDAFVGNAKNLEKINEEGFGFGIFVPCIGPVFGECECAGFDFVPREWFLHGIERLELG